MKTKLPQYTDTESFTPPQNAGIALGFSATLKAKTPHKGIAAISGSIALLFLMLT